MTPGARVAAAIEVLAQVAEGMPAEQALTRWARASRFAGSKDRAAVRDHVFDVLRNRLSAAHEGQGDDPRALMIGLLRLQQADLDGLFTGEGHAPPPLSATERSGPVLPPDRAARLDLAQWLLAHFDASLGQGAEAAAKALRDRAPVFLRVNTLKASRADAKEHLAAEGIETRENPLCDTALTVTQGARRVRNAPAYRDGYVELQDGSSQAIVTALPNADRVLDYCAGGGGKSLALAARLRRRIHAHDIDPARMRDLPERARRAGADIVLLPTGQLAGAAPFDLVLCDAPCSGSGAWRRSPEGKWRLTPERLEDLTALQDDILFRAAQLTVPGGTLAYATCSVLHAENEARVETFLGRLAGWSCRLQRRFDIGPDGDGFFIAHLQRDWCSEYSPFACIRGVG